MSGFLETNFEVKTFLPKFKMNYYVQNSDLSLIFFFLRNLGQTYSKEISRAISYGDFPKVIASKHTKYCHILINKNVLNNDILE